LVFHLFKFQVVRELKPKLWYKNEWYFYDKLLLPGIDAKNDKDVNILVYRQKTSIELTDIVCLFAFNTKEKSCYWDLYKRFNRKCFVCRVLKQQKSNILAINYNLTVRLLPGHWRNFED